MSKQLMVKPGVIQFLFSHGPLAPIEEAESILFKYVKDYAQAKSQFEKDLIARCAKELSTGYALHPSNTKDNIKHIKEMYNECFGKIE